MTTGHSPESVPARAPAVAAPSSTGAALAALREATAATRSPCSSATPTICAGSPTPACCPS